MKRIVDTMIFVHVHFSGNYSYPYSYLKCKFLPTCCKYVSTGYKSNCHLNLKTRAKMFKYRNFIFNSTKKLISKKLNEQISRKYFYI
jgi:hypothetical protein